MPFPSPSLNARLLLLIAALAAFGMTDTAKAQQYAVNRAPVYYPPQGQQWRPQPQFTPPPGDYPFGHRPALPALPAPEMRPVVMQPPAAPRPVFRPSGLVQAIGMECERLSRMGLRYQFGSMDPGNGGLDCSGSVKCTLERAGVRNVPRTASDQYVWLQRAGTLTELNGRPDANWVLSRVRPGDLLFWRGTYVTNRWPDVSHVMIYLGRHPQTGKPMMFGARSTGSSRGINGNAVDIYEFNPVPRGKAHFIGFGPLPVR